MENTVYINDDFCNGVNQNDSTNCFLRVIDLERKLDILLFEQLLQDIMDLEYSPENILKVSHLERVINQTYFANQIQNDLFKFSNNSEIDAWENQKMASIVEELACSCNLFYRKGLR
jgi:hypothetical protein